jgi:hypothetical protein
MEKIYFKIYSLDNHHRIENFTWSNDKYQSDYNNYRIIEKSIQSMSDMNYIMVTYENYFDSITRTFYQSLIFNIEILKTLEKIKEFKESNYNIGKYYVKTNYKLYKIIT